MGPDIYSQTGMNDICFCCHKPLFRKVLCGKTCCDAKATSSVRNSLFFIHCDIMNVSKLEDRVVVDFRKKSVVDNYFYSYIRKGDRHGMISVFDIQERMSISEMVLTFVVKTLMFGLLKTMVFCLLFHSQVPKSHRRSAFPFEISVSSNSLAARCGHIFCPKF